MEPTPKTLIKSLLIYKINNILSEKLLKNENVNLFPWVLVPPSLLERLQLPLVEQLQNAG